MAHGGPEHFSDIFRYQLLCQRGGWWVDTDVICNTTDAPDCEIAFAGVEKESDLFSTGQLKFPKGHPALVDLIEYVKTIVAESRWGSTGPFAFTEIIRKHNLESYARDISEFYPLSWSEAPKFLFGEFIEEVLERTAGAKFIHLYSSALRHVGFDVTKYLPPRGSYLEKIYEKYCDAEVVGNLRPIVESDFRRHVKQYLQQEWYRSIFKNLAFP